MLTKNPQLRRNSGQTLIETLVAVFILVMGITAALGLATYSLRASSDIQQKIIAMGLAREGIEAVKNMRDTNWLNGTLSQTCYTWAPRETGDPTHASPCYTDWLDPVTQSGVGYYLNTTGNPQSFVLKFNSANDDVTNYWDLEAVNVNAPSPKFGVTFSESNLTQGLYFASDQTVTASNSGYGRLITITPENQFAPFDQDTGPRLKVTVNVWWTNRNCPVSDTVPTGTACKITLETYLTNWKTF